MAERKEFYKHLKAFLRELVVVFPEDDDDLKTITMSINLAIIDDDSDEIIKRFYNSLQPLEREIKNRDTGLFNKIVWGQHTYEYRLFTKLKNNWNNFSENNKGVVWDYLNVLYTISLNIIF